MAPLPPPPPNSRAAELGNGTMVQGAGGLYHFSCWFKVHHMTHKALMCFGCLTKLDKAKSCLALLLAATYHNNTGARWGDIPYMLGEWNSWKVRRGKTVDGPKEKWRPYVSTVKDIIKSVMATNILKHKLESKTKGSADGQRRDMDDRAGKLIKDCSTTRL